MTNSLPAAMAGTPAQNGNNAAGNNDSSRKTVELCNVEGPDLPEVDIGQIVPSIVPIISDQIGDDGKRRHTWKWTMPNAPVTGRPPAEGGESDVIGDHDGS